MDPTTTPPATPTPPYGGPGYGGLNPAGPPPKNWLVESILVTIFCGCGFPFGIVGIVNAANVNSKWAGGDYAGAQEASAAAGKWTKIGFFVGIGATVIYFALVFLGVMGGMMGGFNR